MAGGDAKQIDRLYRECWAEANLGLAVDILHPEIVWTAIESAPDFGTRRGLDEVRGYMNEWLDDFDVHSDPVELIGTATTGEVVCALHQTGTSKRTGLEMDIHYAVVVGFADDGRILAIDEYASREEALQAAQLAR
jgi:ketosteroid isomerase-like protein